MISTNTKAFLYSFYCLSLLLILAKTNAFRDIISNLNIIINREPLPSFYFELFIIIGLVAPIIIRIVNKHIYINKNVLDPYLIFLLGQIITEILVVKLLGKGGGVVVGFLFSSLRLGQLKSLVNHCHKNLIFLAFIYLQLILWSVNCIQIIGNRFLYLINMT
tara:strand:+ start:94 stop:579 length:486 start_codon:yes stop_codon:yes gene_type:complete